MMTRILKAFLGTFILIFCAILTVDTLFLDWKYKKVKNADTEPKCCWCNGTWKMHGPGDWVNHASLYNQMRNSGSVCCLYSS